MPPVDAAIDCSQCALFGSCPLSGVLCSRTRGPEPVKQLMFFKPGQYMLHTGDMTDSLYVVKAGLAMLGQAGPDGKDKPLALVGRGHVLGVRGLSGKPTLMWLKAQSDVALCRLPKAQMSPELEATLRDILPDLYGRSVMALLAWAQLIRVANLKQRVLSALMLLAETQGSAVRVYLPRQADLAGLLNITRESVGRILGELERDGVVLRIGRNWVDVIQGRADAGGGANRLHDLS